MPPRCPSASTLRALRAQIESRPFRCQHCTSSLASRRRPLQVPPPSRRGIAHVAPVTSVNAAARVPARFQELHGALQALEDAGANYVSLSQLRLALHGLEAEDAPVRVAVLGVGGQDAARRLVRTLLADPLGTKQRWEELLVDEKDGRAVVVQYGDEFAVDERNPLLRRISMPAALLRKHRLELLVSYTGATRAREGDETSSADAVSRLLRLELGTRPSGSRPQALYQVHKTVVLGEGMDGAETVFKIVGSAKGEGTELVHGGVSLAFQDLGAVESPSKVSLVNISEAEAAVQMLRDSLENSFKYEHAWLGSNVEALSAFITAGTIADGPLKPALEAQMSLMLTGTTRSVEHEEAVQHAELEAAAIDSETEQNLRLALESWGEFAHTELRDALANAELSRAWRKLSWWKLPWRVDDVAMLAGDVLQRAYLVNAERHLLWIGGYFRAAGLVLAEHHSGNLTRTHRAGGAGGRWFDALPAGHELRDMYLDEVKTQEAARRKGDDEPATPLSPLNPWPQQVGQSRVGLQARSVPELQARAQGVLVRAASSTALSGAVGALAFAADVGAYGAGSLAALGLAWSLRRAQAEWESARGAWLVTARDEGRAVLERVLRRGTAVVDDAVSASRAQLEAGGDGARDRELVRELVRRAREALEQLQGGGRGA